MRQKIYLLATRKIWMLIFVLSSPALFAQTVSSVQYVENKGQWDPSVLYKGDIGNGSFYIQKKGFSVLMHNPQDFEAIHQHGHKDTSSVSALRKESPRLRSHLYKVSFENANETIQLIPDKVLPNYNNYFIGNDPSKWAGNCRIYLGITAKNVYDGVDARYYSEAGQLKYDLVVAPGTDVKKIKMRYEGVENINIRNKQLIIPTSVGEAKELYPYSYQFSNNTKQSVDCQFTVKGNVVSFDVKNYAADVPLIIDPTIVFATLSGSRADNWGMSATYGPDGSFFGGSIALASGFIITPGAYDNHFEGGSGNPPCDMAIMKFSPTGNTLVWATYIGGSGSEFPHSLVADAQGNLIIAGRTNSPAVTNASGVAYPVTGTFGTLGTTDIVVTKLNASGSALIGSMRIGGDQIDGANIEELLQTANSLKQNYGDNSRSEVILDGNGNILLASNTHSTNFPVKGGFQNSLAGEQDGVIIKLNNTANAVIWSTYFGGTADDATYVLAIDPITKKIYAAGGTGSATLPGVVGGVFQSSNLGGIADGFITSMVDNGASVTMDKTTFLGTTGIDQVYGVQFDDKGFPYVMGQTTGSWPIKNATYSVSNSRQFITKLQPDLSTTVYSTCFGTSGATAPNISPVAFLVDKCENVYVSGWGGAAARKEVFFSAGTIGLPVTPDAFQKTTDGSDFYFFILQKNAASQLFGSFFGEFGSGGSFGEHVDGGTSRFDRQGIIYQGICANCGGSPKAVWPATFGSWSTVNGTTDGCNYGALKIAMNFSGVEVGLKAVGAKQLTFCLPATVEFADTLKLAKQYIWDYGDGSKKDTTTSNSIQHTYNQIGFFNIKLIGIDTNTCNERDSAFLRIRVTTDSVKLGFTYKRQDPCTSLTFDFTNTSSVQPPTPPPGPKSFVWIWNDGSPADTSFNATHTFPGPGTYDVQLLLIDSNYCNAYETFKAVNFSVASIIKADFDVTPACIGQPVIINDKSVGAATYLWDFGDGTTSTDSKPVHTYDAVGTYTITLTINNPNSCNLQDVITKTVTVNPVPTAAFSFTPNPSKDNTPTTFINNSSPDAIRYEWDFGDGKTSTEKNPQHQYRATNIYNVCLKAFNSFGCYDSVCIPVEAKVIIGVVVPNAFTPNNDGKNDVLLVKAFGVSKMTFRIYNRQGQKVFESADLDSGWDGRYKGVLQPTDAYAYTLDIEFYDGKKERLKGDITLIR
ncbi:MAG: PKD domain-containing protein [Sphingobacteriales bacterium]|nr:PKD domain-containing protein [Sphingobacteriales bacterium]